MQENREKFETRAQSYYNKAKTVIDHGIFYPDGVDKFIVDKENEYKQKVQDASPINQSHLSGNYQLLERAKSDLDRAVNNMWQSMENDPEAVNGYHVTKFMNEYARLREMETRYKTIKKSVERQEMVEHLFGDYTTFKKDKNGKAIPKSSQDLIAERNERLAMIGDLYHREQLFSKEQYLENIAAVVNCYHMDTQTALDREVAEMANQPTGFNKFMGDTVNKISNPFKKLVGTVKNFMRIGEPVSTVEDKDLADAKRNLDCHQALEVLGEASDMMGEFNEDSQKKLIDETLIQTQDTPEIHNPSMEALVAEVYDAKYKALEKKYKGDLENENFQSEAKSLKNEEKCALSPFNSYGILKDPEWIKQERSAIDNYLLKNYKHTFKQLPSENGSFAGSFVFEDPKIQSVYEEFTKTFNTIEGQREDLGKAQAERREQTTEISKRIEEERIIEQIRKNRADEAERNF